MKIQPYVLPLAEVVKKILPMPDNAVVIGMGADGLPVCIDVSSPKSSNVIVWDKITGQGVKIIKTAVNYIVRYKNQSLYRTEFVILSNNSKEWLKLSDSGLGVWDRHACIAVAPFWERVAEQVLCALAEWCVKDGRTRRPVLLFIDGLENIDRMGEGSVNHLRQILSIGRNRNIFIVATASSENRADLARWFEYFQREVYGQESLHWFEYDENRSTIVFFAPTTEV